MNWQKLPPYYLANIGKKFEDEFVKTKTNNAVSRWTDIVGYMTLAMLVLTTINVIIAVLIALHII
jgi:hypothetical protein